MENNTKATAEENGNIAKNISGVDEGNSKPRKSRGRKKNKVMDRVDIGIIRKKIYQYYAEENEVPTVSTIMEILEEGLFFEREHLKEILEKYGYRYLRCNSTSRRHILVEKNDLACKRISYLQKIRECRSQNQKVYFMHETYMEATEVARRGDHCLRVVIPSKINKRERLVIVHVGGANGLVNGTFTTVKSHSVTGNQFAEVNEPKFMKWINENLKEKLPPNSVIAVSHASYCSIQKDMMPRHLFTVKTDKKGWLRRHNIERLNEGLENIYLYELIRKTRLEPVYVFDELLKKLGHTVLRIPPLHPELNPLEYIWSEIKKNIAKSHQNASVEEKRNIWNKLYSEYSAENWQKLDDMVKNTEEQYYDREEKFDDIIDEIIGRYEKDANSDSETCESGNEDSDTVSE